MKFQRSAVIAAAIVGATVVAGCSGSTRDRADSADCAPGITDDSIKLGSSTPQSGPAAVYKAVSDTSKAYFEEINADGGVKMGDGKTRKIEYIAMDDGLDPARTVSNIRRLVEKDDVFALFQAAGTSGVLGVLDYTTQQGIPFVLPLSGNDQFEQRVADGALLSLAMLPKVSFESEVLAASLIELNPKAKIGVLYANDATGKDSLSALKKAIEGTDLAIVGEESYEGTSPTVDAQIVALKSSGADALFLYATGSFATQSLRKVTEIGWDPETFVQSAASDSAGILLPAGKAAADGVHSVAWAYDVASSTNDDKPGMKAWREFAGRHTGQVIGESSISAIGYTNAQLLVEVLEKTQGCTRDDFVTAATELKGAKTDLALPGVEFGSGSANNPYAIAALAPITFTDGAWVYDSPVPSAAE